MSPTKVMQGLLALSDVLPLPSLSTFEDWVHQQEHCLCLLLALLVGEDDFFPLALSQRCCDPVSCVTAGQSCCASRGSHGCGSKFC